MKINCIKINVAIISFIIICLIFLTGCFEEENEENKENDNELNGDNIEPYYENMIIGTWVGNQSFENFTYIIEYRFYSNNSFFSGIKEEGVESYNDTIMGNYTIDSEEIQFTVEGDNVTYKYLLSPEGDLLLLYYENGIDYDLLRKEI